jgi:hypothetical protein
VRGRKIIVRIVSDLGGGGAERSCLVIWEYVKLG